MNNLLAIIVLAIVPFIVSAQNHVPNASFEDTLRCPLNISDLDGACVGWRQYTKGSADYYHPCNSGSAGVPGNQLGWQKAYRGNAYAGIIVYDSDFGSPYKEYISSAISPLTKGRRYEVTMWVCNAEYGRHATDALGAFFFDRGLSHINTLYNTYEVAPQITYYSQGIISDTQNWTKLTNYFIADSAYDNIVIGSFIKSANMNVNSPNAAVANTAYAYYFIDSVTVVEADSFWIDYADTSWLCSNDTIQVPCKTMSRFLSNNIFTVQLSDSAGSFASPVNIGSKNSDTDCIVSCVIPAQTKTSAHYRLRFITSHYADTSAENIFNIKIGKDVLKPIASNNGPVCPNDTLMLSATSSADARYRWTGPRNFKSDLQNTFRKNPTPGDSGNYIVTAYIYGCEASDTTKVVTYGGAGTFFAGTFYNGPLCVGDTLKLQGGSNTSGQGVTYSWTGPDNFSSTHPYPVIQGVTTAKSGKYAFTVDRNGCKAHDTIAVIIHENPNITAGYNTPLCTGDTLKLNVSGSINGSTYAWTGPSGFASTLMAPLVNNTTAANSGDYIVHVKYFGCNRKDTVSVQVNPYPAKPTVTNNGPVCAGEILSLTSMSATGNVTYTWTGPENFSSDLQNPSILNTSTNMSGDYTVAATLNGCSQKATTPVVVKITPVVTVSHSQPVCEGGTLQLYTNGVYTGATYNWSGPQSFLANTQNTNIANLALNRTGWYKMDVDLDGCPYKDSIAITVNAIPPAPVVSYNNPLCVGETLTLNGGNITNGNYNWTGPNGFSSLQANATRTNVQTADAGIYKTKVSVNGCTSPEGSITVNLNPVPFVVIFSNPIDSICKGSPAMFTAIPNNYGGIPTYQWLVNNQPVATGPSYTTTILNNQDLIRCDMTEITRCSIPYKDASNDITMTVLPWVMPAISITANPTTPLKLNEYVTFTAKIVNGGVNPKYQWKRNGQDVVGATGHTWSANTLNDNDEVSVEFTSDYKCPQPAVTVSNGIKVRVLTGVNDIDDITGFSLYPNPNKGSFIIKGKVVNNGAITTEIINSIGQVIYKDVIQPQAQNCQKEIQLDAPAGVYLLRLYTENNRQSLKFNIE